MFKAESSFGRISENGLRISRIFEVGVGEGKDSDAKVQICIKKRKIFSDKNGFSACLAPHCEVGRVFVDRIERRKLEPRRGGLTGLLCLGTWADRMAD